MCPHCKATHYSSVSHTGSNRRDKEQPTFGTIQVTFKVSEDVDGKSVSKMVQEIWTAKDVLMVL